MGDALRTVPAEHERRSIGDVPPVVFDVTVAVAALPSQGEGPSGAAGILIGGSKTLVIVSRIEKPANVPGKPAFGAYFQFPGDPITAVLRWARRDEIYSVVFQFHAEMGAIDPRGRSRIEGLVDQQPSG